MEEHDLTPTNITQPHLSKTSPVNNVSIEEMNLYDKEMVSNLKPSRYAGLNDKETVLEMTVPHQAGSDNEDEIIVFAGKRKPEQRYVKSLIPSQFYSSLDFHKLMKLAKCFRFPLPSRHLSVTLPQWRKAVWPLAVP